MRFFTLRDCPIVEQHPAYITVELNIDTDKDLGYRPFYWSYIENTNLQPQLLVKRYIFDPTYPKQELGDEYLYYGSRRLHQIFMSTKKRGQFVRLYEEQSKHSKTTALIPWIMINYKIDYICDQKKEHMVSYGYNLVTGELREQFFDRVKNMNLTSKLPDYVFTQPPKYPVNFATQQFENAIKDIISKEDKQWVIDAWSKYEEETNRLEQYFLELHDKPLKKGLGLNEADIMQQLDDEKKKRSEEVSWQYKPRVQICPSNAGVFFLHTRL